MGRWFRFYDDAINDPKILHLPEVTRWHWAALLCIASKNNGRLPPIADIATMLRKSKSAAAAILAGLVNAGLIDRTDTGYEPHNWNGRQYKADVTDPTAPERMKRYREKKRNGDRNDRNGAVTVIRPETEQTTEQIDRIGSAQAREPDGFTEGSKALADAFWRGLGFASKLEITPEFSGVDWRAIGWESAGWSCEMVESQARLTGRDKPLTYHEKVFATAHARLRAPLPKVEIREAETVRVNHAPNRSSGSVTAAFREIREQMQSGHGDEAGGNAVLRLSSR